MVLFIYYVVVTFESVVEILWFDHSNETSSAELSDSAIYFFGFIKRYLEFYTFSTIRSKRVI